MKFLFTGDIHLSRYAQDQVEDQSNLPERLHSIKTALYNMANYCLENSIENFIIGGDIMHTKSVIYSIAQNIMLDFFDDFEDLQFWVLDGNHDLSGKGAGVVSALRCIKPVNNVEWITQTPTGNQDFICIPYSFNVVDQVKQNKRRILISHFGLQEGLLNSGISIVSEIKLADLIGQYELVLLGHYHKPQEIIRADISLYYVGSPVQLDWGEKGDVKRFLIVDTDTLDVQSIPTIGYKKHIELEINSANKNEILKQAEIERKAGNYIKLIKTESVEIKTDFAVIDKSEKDITDRGITSSMSEEDKLKRFMQIKEVPLDKYDRYLNAALDIINTTDSSEPGE
jgi:DNA repair exonuclease SbcCD nuclease subunit